MANVVLDLNCIIFKYTLETSNYNKVGSVIYWAQIFNYKNDLFFHNSSLAFREVFFGAHILLNTNSQ